MKFLIDECLHTTLVDVARECGHEANHINYLGLSGETDWDLMPRIVADDYTFVTNNAQWRRSAHDETAISAHGWTLPLTRKKAAHGPAFTP